MALVEQTKKRGPYGDTAVELEWDKLAPGDEVAFISGRHSYYGNTVKMYTVERLTATQIVMTDGTRWYRKTGRQVASNDYYPLLHPQADDVIDAHQHTQHRLFLRALEGVSKRKATTFRNMMSDADDATTICASFRARITALEGKRRKPDAAV